MQLDFKKYEGLGNDFLVVRGDTLTSAQVIALCDRHRGVGGDGILLCNIDNDGPSMHVINADGTSPEMCGNGLRCAALYFRTEGLVSSDVFGVHTAAGIHQCRVTLGSDEKAASVAVEMNAASFDPGAIGLTQEAPLIDAEWAVDGGAPLEATAVSMGNPHLVLFPKRTAGLMPSPITVAQRGEAPRIQAGAPFENGVNVGFCEPREDDGFDLHVYERGVGWTQACGTGACAAVAAAVRTGRVAAGAEAVVHLPGGAMHITDRGDGARIWMRGPARHVFSGRLDLS